MHLVKASTQLRPKSVLSQPVNLIFKNRKLIYIAHLNICSLKKREHLIQIRLLMQENKFDILAVSESWLTPV